MPFTAGNITVNESRLGTWGSDAIPTSVNVTYMYGIADITFQNQLGSFMNKFEVQKEYKNCEVKLQGCEMLTIQKIYRMLRMMFMILLTKEFRILLQQYPKFNDLNAPENKVAGKPLEKICESKTQNQDALT